MFPTLNRNAEQSIDTFKQTVKTTPPEGKFVLFSDNKMEITLLGARGMK
jgi:hypothetical protein